MAVNNIIKRIQNIMRQDAGINGDAQRIEQMTWMFFLKVYDTQEETWEYKDENYKSIIPEDLRWRKWAVDEKDGEALTGEALLSFVNEKLFPTLKNLPIDANTPRAKSIVQETFADLNQYMKNGTLLRQVVNIVNEIEFDDADDRHTFGDIYEGILKDLQSAGNAGEFYTPRALTDFIVMMLDPKLGETFGDFTSGTGGFLTSALNYMSKSVSSAEDGEKLQNAVVGQEWKPLPYLLSITNLLLHDIEAPNIANCDSLGINITDFKESDKVDVIGMNPDGSLNEAYMKEIMNMATGCRVTLHRAYDMCKNPFEAFETARKLGVDTILTSGQKNSCIEGVKLIKKLVERSSGIEILVGAGVNSEIKYLKYLIVMS